MKMKKLLALLLSVLMVVSLLPMTALAAADSITIIIDLSNYSGEVNGNLTFYEGSGEDIELIAGQKNTIILNKNLSDSDDIEGLITLTDLKLASYNSWEIEGTTADGTDISEYILDDQSQSAIIIFNNTEKVEGEFIRLSGKEITFNNYYETLMENLWNSWGLGTTITISPAIPSEDEYSITVKANDDSLGSVEAIEKDTLNTYLLFASPNDGCSFLYWLNDGLENLPENQIKTCEATIQITTDCSYTAYFHKLFLFNVQSSDETLGRARLLRYDSSTLNEDNLVLIAEPTEGEFEKWTCGEVEYTDNPLRVAISEDGKTFVAHFKPVALELSLPDTGSLIASSDGSSSALYGGIVSEGSRSALLIPLVSSRNVSDASIDITVSVGESTLAEKHYIGNLGKGDNILRVGFDPTPAKLTSVSAKVSVTPVDGEKITVTQTYTGLSVAESETNDAFRFVTSPSDGYTYKTIQSAGANLNGVYARMEDATKALSLYGYGPKGVIVWNAGGVSASRLGSMPLGDGEEVKALGPDGENGLTAAVGSDTSIRLYTWNGESWTAVEGSARAADASQKGTKIALVMDGDDVWTDTKHWTGSGWEDHAYDFASFQRVSDTEAYGVDGSGDRWRYDGSAWTAAEAAPAAPDTSSVAARTLGAGQDQNGDWYCFVQSRFHFIDDSGFYGYNGSDVYKWNGEKWVYQIMTDFNDPDDDLSETKCRIRPDGVQTISSPAPGVSVMYGNRGANGAIYLSTDDVTITFDPGEGKLDDTALATLTAPILSEIDIGKVPGAARTGYVFGGWFYDADCTKAFDATVMPGESITLYAKWTEQDGLQDELAFYRERG